MIERRHLLWAALGPVLMPGMAKAQDSLPAPTGLNEPGPENADMAGRAGLWDVTETVWDAPGAAPVVTTGLVAERRVIGSMLQEVLRPEADATGAHIARIDYLRYSRLEGRWDYVSMDARAPVGIMPAWSFDRGAPGRIDLTFQPFTVPFVGPGLAPQIVGQMLRMTETVNVLGPDRDTKEQYFLPANGSGTSWLAHKYEYRRRS